jgi:hypothetical protein
MLSPYVLIPTEVGKVAYVAQALATWMGCRWPKTSPAPTTSSRVQAPGPDQLGRLVVARIQVQDGVTRTLTCTALQR